MATDIRPQTNGGTNDMARRGDAAGNRQQGGEGERLATGLGWFSIGLGLAQITAPAAMARLVGASGDADSRTLMRAIGVRELTAGVGLLSNPRSAGWAWARVAGDVMDLALLGNTMAGNEDDRGRAAAATAAVLGVTALDVRCAQQLSRGGDGAAASESDGAAGIRVAKSITVNRPPDEVYSFWRNFENLPRFMAHLEDVRVLDGGRSHWKAKAPAGRTVEWDAETTDDRPNELIAWRSLAGADVSNSGTVRFERAAGDRGTQVHVELHYEPPAGKLGALVAKLFGEEPNQQVAGDLRRFKQVLETGEVVYSDATVHRGMHPAHPPEERQAPRRDSEQQLVTARAAEAVDASSNRDRTSSGTRPTDRPQQA